MSDPATPTENGRDGAREHSAEARAEEVVHRVVSSSSRWLARMAGRVREEVEDIVAEGKQVHDRATTGSD